MSQSPYFYFSRLYENSSDTLMCVDSNLNVVYLSNAFREVFGFNINNDILANTLIPMRYGQDIRNAIESQKSFSFDYITQKSDTPEKCFVLPCALENQKFATLLFIALGAETVNKAQSNRLKQSIIEAEREITAQTSAIISELRGSTALSFKQLTHEPNFVSTLKIRKEIENLARLARKEIRSDELFLISLNDNIKRVTQNITELLPKNRVIFNFHLYNALLVTEMKYETFDLLISTAIAAIIKSIKGSAVISVKTLPCFDRNLVVFAENSDRCDDMERAFNSGEQSNCTEIPLVSSIIDQLDGELYCHTDVNGRLSLAFTLPSMPVRADILRDSNANMPGMQDILSVIGTALADIL